MQKSSNILDKISEKIHYDIIPDSDDEKGWDVRLLEEYPETVISYGIIEFDGTDENDPDGKLNYNFKIVSTPDTELSVNDLTFQRYCGTILSAILENAVSDGSLVARGNDTGNVIMTEGMRQQMMMKE